MGVIGFEITRRVPYQGGAEFGATGAYDRIDGVLRYAVDPDAPANRDIVDLALAPRDPAGRVQFEGDLCLLVPRHPGRGNHRLLAELPNRGRKLIPRHFNRAPSQNPPTAEILPGDGFLFRHGYTVAWVGWQWDVVRSDALMGLRAPRAMQDGRPVRGTTVCRFQPNFAHHTHLLADRVHHPYPAADLDDPDAVLTERDYEDGEPRVVPRDRWRFGHATGGRVEPDREHVFLEGGFQPGLIYELTYTTDLAPVVGTGLLAVRDAVSFLRYAAAFDNPCAGTIEHAYGFGMSQTGRMLRHFLFLGLNRDESGRMVFDGVMPHVAGARRGEFNHRFGQPSVQATPGFGHLPPFADEPQPGAAGGEAGLLARQRAVGCVPKIFWTNSSAEYWRGDCALLHVDPSGGADLDPAPEARIYHFAGTQHGPGSVPLVRDNPNDGARGRYGFNAVDYTPLLRAALVNLDRWAGDGVEPPPSAHPRLADGSAVDRATVLAAFRTLPGMVVPDPARLPVIRRVDLGPRAGHGVGRFPAVEGEPYPALVAAVDADRNEVAGLRLPDLTVPVGSHTGWNPRAPETGGADQIIPMEGTTRFFARTAAERAASGDPRPSLAERYGSRDEYRERVRAAARELVAARYVLDEDVDHVVTAAAERYDCAMVAGPED
ncbi:MAG TPA: alpha/beta hydrolase domain-containing protein [Thermomicrobiaceae bacterium]|nr:alpha/beta hydrolase domain-containing protein [Thermomicrobiaceae bacterium]